MVSGVAERLGFSTDNPKKKKHKRKVDKEHGKKHVADESRSSSGEEVWVEADSSMDVQVSVKSAEQKPATECLKRDEWMTKAVGPSAMSVAAVEERQRERSKDDGQEKMKVRNDPTACVLARL